MPGMSVTPDPKTPDRIQALAASYQRNWGHAARLWTDEAVKQGDFEAWFRLGESLFFLRDYRGAIDASGRAITQRPDDVRPRIVAARCYTGQGPEAANEAARSWQLITERTPEHFEAWVRLCQSRLRLNQCELALNDLVRALNLQPQHALGIELGAQILSRLEPASLSAELERVAPDCSAGAQCTLLQLASRLVPCDLELQDRLARLLIQDNDYAAAVAPLAQLLQANPNDLDLLRHYARALHRAELWEDAIQIWRRLLHRRPRELEPSFRLSQALRLAGHFEDARRQFRATLQRNPGEPEVLDDFTRLLVALGQTEEAEALWRTALKLRPEDARLQLEFSAFLMRLHRPTEALPMLLLLAERQLGFDRAALLLYQALRQTGEHGRILQLFAPLIAAGLPREPSPTACELGIGLGLLLMARGRTAEAETMVEPAVAAAPASREALSAMLRLRLAQQRPAEARAAANRLLSQHGSDALAWRDVIVGFAEGGAEDLALAALREAAELFREQTSAWLDIVEAMPEGLSQAVLREHLAQLVASRAADRARAASLALGIGDLALADRLLGEPPAADLDTAEWHRVHRSLTRWCELAGDFHGPGLQLPDAAIDLLCAGAPQPADVDNGPVVLVSSSLGGGGAERQLVLTLRGLVELFGTAEPLKLICTRMTRSAERRVHLAEVQALGVSVNDLAEQESTGVDLSTLSESQQDLIALLGNDLGQPVAKLYDAFRRLRPRVVHLWQDRICIEGGIAALLAGVPRVVLGTRSLRPHSAQRLRGYMRTAYQALLRHPQVVLVNNSEAGARDYAEWLSLPAERVQVVPNGFRVTELARIQEKQDRRALSIPEQSPVVGGVLRLVEVKQPLLWIEVAARLAAVMPDVHFLVVGDGPLRSDVERLAVELGLTRHLHLVGRASAATYYGLMDVVLLTSATEGLPNVLVEAQAHGRPVVATRVGGVTEAMLEGITGFSVMPGDADMASALAERVKAVLDDAAWRRNAATEARRFISHSFAAEAMVVRTLALYGMPTAVDSTEEPTPAGSAHAGRLKARTLANAQNWPAALEAWAALLAERADDEEALLGSGIALFHQSRLAEAKERFVRAMRLAPDAETLRWLARTLRGLDDTRGAEPLWEELRRVLPQDLEAWLRSTETAARLGNLKAAVDLAEQARRRFGADARLIRLQARLLTQAGAVEAALQQWRQLAQAMPGDAEALFRAGQAAQSLGENAAAEAWLRAAQALAKSPPGASAALARLLAWDGRWREARQALRQGLRLYPDDTGLWTTAFELLRAAAHGPVQDRYFRALSRRAGDVPARRLRLAEQFVRAGAVSRARTELQRLMVSPEAAPAAADLLAQLALRAADCAAAMELSRMTPLQPHRQQELRHIGSFVARFRKQTGQSDPNVGWLSHLLDSIEVPAYLPRPGSVLHLINSLATGGSERQCVALARAQAGAGRTVTVLRADPAQAGRASFFVPALAQAGIRTYTLAAFALGTAAGLAKAPSLAVPPGFFGAALCPSQVGPLLAALVALRPEQVMIWSPQCMASGAIAAMALRVPHTILRSGSVALPLRADASEFEQERYRLWRASLACLVRHCGGLLLNNAAANLPGWLEWLGLDATVDRVGVLPNIVDLAEFMPAPAAEVAALRDRLAIPPRAPVVGSVIRLEREKGVDCWFEAVRATHALRQDVVFAVAGDGRLRERLRRQLEESGLASAVRLLGQLGDTLPLHYSMFDALLLTSSVEGLPNAVLEAQCFGLPVIAPRVGGVAEALDGNPDHRLLEAAAPGAAWADALLSSLTSTGSRLARQFTGRRFIATRFSAAVVLQRLERLIAKRNAAGPPMRDARHLP